MPASQQIVEHAHLRKQLAVLECPSKTKPGDLVRRTADELCPAKTDRAAAAIDAADAVDHACLAGAVRSDQREQLAGRDCERNVLEHSQTAEVQAQVLNAELSHTTSA